MTKSCFSHETAGHCWSSYHTSNRRKQVQNPGITTTLPLLREKVHTLDTIQYHCEDIMDKTIEITESESNTNRCM